MTLIFGIVAGLIAFAIGGLWYGMIFRDAWIKASGIDMAKVEADRPAGKNGQKEMMISLVIEVLTAVVAIFFIKTLDVSPLHAAGGMGVIAVLASLKNYIFEQRPINLILINESYKLVCYLVVGIIALFA
ncbi:TPA: DUF1761 domain-containing protein [Streptococcus suis]|uniref:DUF1761 domain-containing protein n=1 Tax=Streptococcus suis TaxID=1307 RepID=UPI000CF6F43C|nr:DUF1761 domain-containing protein [Streptococcus suis]HEL2279092.1 DUF1761 domain-containing protein [Streptococcus suis]HEM2752879.1 DUF1761 domain-containing protein [Streptococcus suis]HEM5281029.1 DUF1761 domain-containing protein [Streptococcus suis]HEP1799398.1 DUF1761 domain-containing protein [Streptococcus suis]